MKKFKTVMALSFEKQIFRRAIFIAVIVGLILNLINQGDVLLHLNFSQIDFTKFGLTFFVPYFVSTYSSVLSNKDFQTGEESGSLP